jgi:hypothetical protein
MALKNVADNFVKSEESFLYVSNRHHKETGLTVDSSRPLSGVPLENLSGSSAPHQFIFHTDDVLRKHGLLVEQNVDTDEFRLVDWITFRPASHKRASAFEAECL